MVSQQRPGLGGALRSRKDVIYVGKDTRDGVPVAFRPGKSTQEP